MNTLPYRDVVRTGQWARPLASSLVGRVHESMISVGLVLLVHQNTGSYASAGLAVAAFGLCSALAAPVAGRALDRIGQRPVLVSLVLTFALVLVAIVVSARHMNVAMTIALAGLAGVSRPPLDSAMRATWAIIVTPPQLPAAYVIDAVSQELIWIVGPLLLSALLLIGGADGVLLGSAALTTLGGVIYASTSAVPRRRAVTNKVRTPSELWSRALSSLLVADTLYGVAGGALGIALTAFCVGRNSGPAVGVLLAVWGVGSIFGGVAYGARAWSTPPAERAMLLLGGVAILLACLNVATSVLGLGVLMFVLGLPFAPYLGTLSAAVQMVVPADRSAEGFTWVTATAAIGTAIGSGVAGPLTQAHPRLGFLFAAAAAAVGAVAGLAGLRGRKVVC